MKAMREWRSISPTRTSILPLPVSWPPRLETRYDDIRWQDVPVHVGSFQPSGLDGRLYGSNHEEAGGVFERNEIAGAFSLIRQ